MARAEESPLIGQPLNRVDGPLKVTGRATYAYEQWEAGPPLYGFILGATIGRGRITRIDTARAERLPGVRLVMTHHNAPPQGTRDESTFLEFPRAFTALANPEIHFHGEPVALAVATTFEQARAAAGLIDVTYAVGPGRYDFAARLDHARTPKKMKIGLAADTAVGDFDAGFDAADVTIDQHYTTPFCSAQPMEPHACLAVPRGEDLIVHTGIQIVDMARTSIAGTLRMDERRIHVVSPYIGGGFGSKLRVHYETILAAIAARVLDRPVKIALTRQQTFPLVGMRPTSHQRVRLGSGRDGRLVAIAHDVTMSTNPDVEYAEQTGVTTRSLYAAPHRATSHRLTALDLPRGEDVRAPGHAPGLMAVEAAMDELAHELSMDPVELRIRNEPELDPERGVPFSDRHLVDCLREGERRFGWKRRPMKPATLREGRRLIGYGVAAAIRPHPQWATRVRVRLEADGTAVVQSDMTDMGTGTYTTLTQVAADGLGLPPERVRVELGRSEFPVSGGSGASWGAGNSSTAVHRACAALRDELLAAACGDTRSPLYGRDPATAVLADGGVRAGGVSVPLGEIVGLVRPGGEGLAAEGGTRPMAEEPNYAAYSINTYGAHFAEVGVDADTGEIRLRRMLGVFSAGRVLNAKTARSQLLGGMIWGLGMALEEAVAVDVRSGALVNRDLAQYLVPVHADVPEIDAVILEGFDEKANPLGVKGLGELGICGAGAAVGNAVFNATGVRVRDFPITLEKLLPGLPPQE
ncbi:xanthine dehydrogenase family protein molybdopterin-binding subunit [Streptomyces lushanensis]|uniref:xanthine dehydrogenase family protein molybdopterin-binding subunit n=1 Tax=Streptomyces lushanensis TaxID=1434255 RepID=UPI000A801AA5|nr:xanthine dehydrogenase family protein molybdopterin-binding subunit [Streptomyces lushanensis]